MLSNENGGSNMVMPVSPMGGGYGGGFGNGGFGGDWGWIILLLLFAGGGWGNGFGGGYGGYDFPWLFNGQQNINTNTNNGFRDAMINDNITSVRDGIHGLSTQICGGFSDVQMGMANGFANVEQGANARQMADMQQMFGLQSALQNCCCENRLATANLTATVLQENCADRAALSDGIRDIIASQNAGTQRILDQMCNDKIDAKNEKIADLERQLTMANLAASQGAQTAVIQAGQRALANEVEQYVLPTPRPAYIVQNPNCCTQNTCGCGSF